MAQVAAAHDHSATPGGPRLAGIDEIPVLSEEEIKKAKKKKRIKVIGLVVVLLLVAHVVEGKVVKPHYGANVPNAGTYGLGGVTTNLADGHLAQITVTLQLTKAADTKTIGKFNSQLTSSTVSLIGRQSFASLLPPSGRSELRTQLLASFQKVLGINEGAQQVSAVYFTSFVLQ
jgi:flagellar basal body-associated protein FliL